MSEQPIPPLSRANEAEVHAPPVRQRSKVQVKVRIPTATKQALDAIAAHRGVSLSDVIVSALREAVRERDKAPQCPDCGGKGRVGRAWCSGCCGVGMVAR